MTHSPPVPPGNMSTYPIHEPPHAHAAPLPKGVPVAATPAHPTGPRGTLVAALVGVGVGAVALAAGALLLGNRTR